jgi:hypothetical protein
MVPLLRAQQEEAPASAGEQAPAAVSTGTEPQTQDMEPSPGLVPDTRPLSGAEELRVETAGRSRSFVIPSLRLTAFGDSNQTILATGTGGVEMTGSIVGGLALQQVTRKNQFSLDYQGGGLIYARNSELNATMHQLGFTETFQGRRWGFTLGDRFSYLPESPFGFAGFGPSLGFGGEIGGGIGNWNPAFTGGQGLFSGRGNRIANNSLIQIQYKASSRSSFTVTGSHGLLRFLESDGIDSDFGIASAGYNYAVTRHDTIAIAYGFSAFRFKGADFHLDNHFVNLHYGRRLTGRLAMGLAGGPQISISRAPSFGTENRVSWNAHSSIDYQLSRTSLNLSYAHYTSSGSGLLYGATTDLFSGGLGRQLTRHWYWSAGPGYSRNAQLPQGPAASLALSYNSVFASTEFHRELGRYTDVSFSYSLHNQWSNAQNPIGINTGSSYLRHMFGIGVTWHAPRIAMH